MSILSLEPIKDIFRTKQQVKARKLKETRSYVNQTLRSIDITKKKLSQSIQNNKHRLLVLEENASKTTGTEATKYYDLAKLTQVFIAEQEETLLNYSAIESDISKELMNNQFMDTLGEYNHILKAENKNIDIKQLKKVIAEVKQQSVISAANKSETKILMKEIVGTKITKEDREIFKQSIQTKQIAQIQYQMSNLPIPDHMGLSGIQINQDSSKNINHSNKQPIVMTTTTTNTSLYDDINSLINDTYEHKNNNNNNNNNQENKTDIE